MTTAPEVGAPITPYIEPSPGPEPKYSNPQPPPPPLPPLTPAEVGHLAELRATPDRTQEQSNEMADLALRENARAPLAPLRRLSDEERPLRIMLALEQIQAMLDGIVESTPALVNMRFAMARLRGHIAALRAGE